MATAAILPAVIGAAGSVGAASAGGKKGGGGGDSAAARLQAQIAADLYNQTNPLRQTMFGTPATAASGTNMERLQGIDALLKAGYREVEIGGGEEGPEFERVPLTSGEILALQREREALIEGAGGIPRTPGLYESFLNEGKLPAALDVPYTAYREGLEDQYGVARENILSRVPSRGGQLNDQLANIEMTRARDIAAIPLQSLPLREALFNNIMRIASGAPAEAAGISATSGQLFNQIAQQSSIRNRAFGEDIGGFMALAAQAALSQGQSAQSRQPIVSYTPLLQPSGQWGSPYTGNDWRQSYEYL